LISIDFIGGGSGESEAATYGRLHEKDARRKLEQILGLKIAEAKKVIDKGRRRELTWLFKKGFDRRYQNMRKI